jgi:hypothetical protein
VASASRLDEGESMYVMDYLIAIRAIFVEQRQVGRDCARIF